MPDVFLPVFTELLERNLRAYLRQASAANPLRVQLEGEIRAELAKVNQSMKNLQEAVMQGALSMEQVKEENNQLQESKRRLEKRLNDLGDGNRILAQGSAVLDTLDQYLKLVLTDLIQDRLRFNTLARLFFAAWSSRSTDRVPRGI